MKIVIRLDDITPDMDWNQFNRFKHLLDHYNVCPLFGVVPDNQDDKLTKQEAEDEFPMLVQEWIKQGWCVAMHGYSHCYCTKNGGLFPLNHYSEFAGIPYITQEGILAKGQKHLMDMGIKTDIFMAPAHSFDTNTVKALQNIGFTYITDGFGKVPFKRKGMTYLPISVDKKKSLKDSDGITTFVVHTNNLTDSEYEFYEDLFRNHRQQVENYSEMLCMVPVRQSVPSRIMEWCLATGKHYAVMLCKPHK